MRSASVSFHREAELPTVTPIVAVDLRVTVGALRQERAGRQRGIGREDGAEVHGLAQRRGGALSDHAGADRELVGQCVRGRNGDVERIEFGFERLITSDPARIVVGDESERHGHARAEREAIVHWHREENRGNRLRRSAVAAIAAGERTSERIGAAAVEIRAEIDAGDIGLNHRLAQINHRRGIVEDDGGIVRRRGGTGVRAAETGDIVFLELESGGERALGDQTEHDRGGQ